MRYERADGHTLSCYLRGGDDTRLIDLGGVTGWPGALCIMPQGASSEWEIGNKFEFVHLYLADEELRRLFSETFDRDARLMLLPEATFDHAPGLAHSLVQLAAATRAGNRMLAEQAIVLAIEQLFTDPRHGGERRLVLRGGLAPALRRRLVDYIEANLAQPIRLRDLAAIADLSEFHLQRMFQQTCGVSPYDFILNRRIDRARRMLAGNEPIAQIAAACGFSSQSHLTRLFKVATGTTPFDYRRTASAAS
ncbi:MULTISPECIES: AraC family transcriptional regulator [unclassified Rhizobium]|uniref:helix-turn-helix domain-containing protein n=1 Tax=unclassified Rhizobium TaxID=2613769 RepID=UPI0006F1D738|nr:MULTISPECIES: AraC family transcriptional regulator [unclassified Rhizobium]KQV33182.1 AraC family transcriptional regulator [Rhizobium sp. Root1212]KRD21648.1 AraC family transcriptional regulator [Rhizobium sp. Root268]